MSVNSIGGNDPVVTEGNNAAPNNGALATGSNGAVATGRDEGAAAGAEILPVQVGTAHSSIKYAIELVPIFDGNNIPIRDFINGCKISKKMIPPNSEDFFVQIIIGRIRGEARKTLQGLEIHTIEGLCKYLSDIYMPAQNRYMLHGELVRIHQRDGEGMVSYTNRVKELSEQISEVTDTSQMTPEAHLAVLKEIQAEAVKRMISGLKPEYEVKAPKGKELVQTIQELIQLEKELALNKKLHSESDKVEKGNYKERRSTVHVVASAPVICDYCQKVGHTAEKCYTRINKERREALKLIKCYYCQKMGHYARDCQARKNQEARKTEESKQGNEKSLSQTGVKREDREITRPVYSVQEELQTTQPMTSEEIPTETEYTLWEQCE